MNETEYEAILLLAMRTQSDFALSQLNALMKHLPEKVEQVSIGIHAGDDPEGYFDVTLHVEGPDLHVLNKAVQPYRKLFEAKVEPNGKTTHDLPTFDPFDEDFRGGHTIVDATVKWLHELWPQVDRQGFSGKVIAFGDNDFGSKPFWTLR